MFETRERGFKVKMGRRPRCTKEEMNNGPWTAEEDKMLTDYIKIHGERKWCNVARKSGERKIIIKLKYPLGILD